MKRIALMLFLCLLVSGCSSMLSRPYVVVNPHPEHPIAGEDTSVIKASSKQELVNVIHYFVAQGIEHGVVKLVDYPTPVEEDLYSACAEVANADPLGAYAVEFMKHDYTRVLTNYEANIHITYRRTPEQIRSVVNVTGSSGIRKEVGETLSAFRGELALQVAYFSEDETYIRSLVQQAYYDTPAAAFGMPEFAVALYPDRGSRRIVEITLVYPEQVTTLRAKSAALQSAAETALSPLRYQFLDANGRLELLFNILPRTLTVAPDGVTGSTPWDAMLGDGGSSEGLALAFRLLCAMMEVDCTVTAGTLDGVPHYWNTLGGGTATERHVDLTQSMDAAFFTGEELVTLGYRWDAAPSGQAVGAAPVAATADEIEKNEKM